MGLARPLRGQRPPLFLGWFLRRGIHETAEGRKAARAALRSFDRLLADWLPMVRTFGIVATTNAAYYLTFTYIVERRKARRRRRGLPAREHAEPRGGADRKPWRLALGSRRAGAS